MTPYQRLIDKVHEGKSPYHGFPASEWAGTWYNDPGASRDIFLQAIEMTNPEVIIEVGSYVGESAIHMANIIKKQNRSAAILCIDTWLGSFDFWKMSRERTRNHFGRPDFYYKFLGNVVTNDCHGVIVPLASDSLNGARICGFLGVIPQLIYVDGSHEQGDVLRDYEAYWPLLPSGGGMLVDDLTGWFPGVGHDYNQFCETHNLKPVLQQGEKALLIKP